MARIRTIKPEFWTSEQVMDCSPIARLLFIGLWTFCDDGGRMAYSVKRLKAQIFPADDISSENVRRLIDELSANALIDLYDIEGKQYLQITGWRHQKIEKPSYQFPDKNGHIPEGWNVLNRRMFAVQTATESSRVESIGVERKGGEKNKRSRADARGGSVGSDHPSNSTDDWPSNYREQFAEVYPSNVSMAAALEILDDARRKVSWHGLLVALASYAENKPADRHWMNPKTWLEQERWNDKPARTSRMHKRRHVADELAEEARRLEGEGNGQDVAVGGAELGGDDAQVVPNRKPT